MKAIKNIVYKLLRKILYSGYFGDLSLKENLFKNLPDNLNTYIDIGAYNGHFYEQIAKEKNIKHIILIEPQKNLFNALTEKYKHQDNIKLYNYLLSNKIEDRVFYINKMGATSSSFEFNEVLMKDNLDITRLNKEIITTTTLDNVIPQNNQTIDLLKIDVQGAELLVLQGAKNTLKQTTFIWIEVSFKKIYNNIPTFEEIQQWLSENGFELIEIIPGYRNSKGELLQADCLFKKSN